jgi:hypothetical protein
MTQYPSADEQGKSNGHVLKQNVEANDSTVSDSQMAQAGRDTILTQGNIGKLIINGHEDQWSAVDVEQIELIRQEIDYAYKDKLDKIAKIVGELKRRIQYRINNIPADDRSSILSLLSQLEDIAGKEKDIAYAKEMMKEYAVASIWLVNNKENLVQIATARTFSSNLTFKAQKQHSGSLTTDELRRRFSSDLENYLNWIQTGLIKGEMPEEKLLDRDFLNLDFDPNIYEGAFDIMTCDLIDPEASRLPIDTAETIASYINRFIIEKELYGKKRKSFSIFSWIQRYL